MKADFLTTIAYSDWVANIVPVPNKDGKVCMCVDYWDLNQANPKDNFPLPYIDTLIDNTATNMFFSFMDGFSGYNQIKMAEEDKAKTTFTTHWGTYAYDVRQYDCQIWHWYDSKSLFTDKDVMVLELEPDSVEL